MIVLDDFIKDFPFSSEMIKELQPWDITAKLPGLIDVMISHLNNHYSVRKGVAVHKSATVEKGVIIKAPAVIGRNCFIGSHAYLRGGVFLCESVNIGPGCEIKSSIICQGSSMAHFNFIGDSIIGNFVNFEAGSVIANHFNERSDKRIFVIYNKEIIDTGKEKFGALVGDNSRIGTNAVLSPGTILLPGSIVKRLELIEQK